MGSRVCCVCSVTHRLLPAHLSYVNVDLRYRCNVQSLINYSRFGKLKIKKKSKHHFKIKILDES